MRRSIDAVLDTCSNVAVACSKSGKFTSGIMRGWYSELFARDVSRNSLFFLDAWYGQGPSADLDIPDVTIEYLPKGTTKYCQPLDVYLFRQYKILAKNVIESCRDLCFADHSVAKLSNRFLIIKLHSICYNQVQHPRFQTIWKYAWKKSGYEMKDPCQPFEKLTQILLAPLSSSEAQCTLHGDFPVIKCAYCEEFLYFPLTRGFWYLCFSTANCEFSGFHTIRP